MHNKPNWPKGAKALRALLFAYKGDDKPEKPKVKKTKSSYAGVNNSSFTTDFASGTSGLVDDPNNKGSKIFQTSGSLAPDLASIADTAKQGLGSNLSYLQTNPEERVQSMLSGGVPLYNVLKEQSDRAREAAIGRNLVNAQQGGVSNSTTLGSALGRIYNDDILRQNQLLLAGLDFNNQNARTDAQLGLGTITGLNALMTPAASAAAAQLQTAKGSQDAAAAATAAAMNQAELQYAQAMNAYNQQKSASLGNMIGGGIGTALSLGLAPFTGGASLLALPAAAGGMFSGGGGGSAPVPSSGSFSWTNPFSQSVPNYSAMGNRIGLSGLESTAGLAPLSAATF